MKNNFYASALKIVDPFLEDIYILEIYLFKIWIFYGTMVLLAIVLYKRVWTIIILMGDTFIFLTVIQMLSFIFIKHLK